MAVKKSTRDAYGEFLIEIGSVREDIIVLDADLSTSTQTRKFSDRQAERFFNAGCAEQNLIGVACGFAYCGRIVIASTYSIFGTGRAWDQIRNIMSHDKLDVKLVFTHAGLTNSADGASHQSLEDIAIMRVIPNMKVIVPADANETKDALYAAIENKGPFYLRLRRTEEPVLARDYSFELGVAPVIRDGSDVSIIASGIMVSKALEAASQLEKEGIRARVVNLHTVKPIDADIISKCARETAGIITVEDHSVIGGIGGAVAEVISEHSPTRLIRLGVRDTFGTSAKTIDELLEYYCIGVNDIANAAKKILTMDR